MTEYQELLDYDRARAWKAPSSLRFSVSEPKISITGVELSGELVNESSEEIEVIVFPAYLCLSPRGLEHRLRVPPNVPPPPMRFVMKGRERIEYRTALAWSDYVCERGQEIEIEWSFTYWNDPPRGRFRVVRP
jgi:hypothetical protein